MYHLLLQLAIFYLAPSGPPVGSKVHMYFDQYVSMFVFLSVHSHVSKTTSPNFTKCCVHVTCGCGSVLLWWQCDTLCTFGFVDNIAFSYNAGIRPKSKTTRMFWPVCQMAAPVGRQPALFGRITECKVCCLQLHLVAFIFFAVILKFLTTTSFFLDYNICYITDACTEHVHSCHVCVANVDILFSIVFSVGAEVVKSSEITVSSNVRDLLSHRNIGSGTEITVYSRSHAFAI